MPPAIVEAVERRARSIVLRLPRDAAMHTYAVGQRVSALDHIIVGDEVQAKLAEVLAVYASRDGRLPGDDGARPAVTPDARVLTVDRSYRVLTVQYPSGRTEDLKVGREVKLEEMESGDDVFIQTLEVVSLSLRKRSHGRE